MVEGVTGAAFAFGGSLKAPVAMLGAFVLMPAFDDPADARAQAVLKECLPDRDVVRIPLRLCGYTDDGPRTTGLEDLFSGEGHGNSPSSAAP